MIHSILSENKSFSIDVLFHKQAETKKLAIIEASVMYMIAIVGFVTNLIIIFSLLIVKSLRNRRNFFLIHQAVINTCQCLLSVPIGMSFLGDIMSSTCSIIGGTYVTLVTISLINIGAATVTESYQFEQLLNQGEDNKLSWTFIVLGFVIIWLAAIILHLGITVIGSDPKLFYDKRQGCLLLQRSPRGYILYCMWIFTTVISLFLTITYIRKFFREIEKRKRAEAPFLSLSVIRDGNEVAKIAAGIQQVSQRMNVYLLFIIVFSCTWLPLFLVLIVDRSFAVSEIAIHFLVLIAYSHPALMPLGYFAHAANCLFRPSYELLSNYYNRIGNRLYSLQSTGNSNGVKTSNRLLYLKTDERNMASKSGLMVVPVS